jgi:uncharacterized protein (TIGR03066 family)
MVTSSALFLVASLVGQPPGPPPSFRELAKTATFYYTAPDPAFGPRMLKELLKKENLEHPFFANNDHLQNINAALLGAIAAGKPKIVRAYEAAFVETPPAGQRLVIRALRHCGDQETVNHIDAWRADRRCAEVRSELDALKKHLEDPRRKPVRDLPAREPKDLDLLWANFFITGEYAPVARILDVLDLPDAKDNETLQRVAKWSLGSNLQQHPKLVELVRKHATDRREGSRKVIDELIARAPDPKAGAATTAAVVGKWVSDDDERIPLEFLKDGTAKVGFFKEKGAWVIATGTYSVSDQGAVKCEVRYEGSTLFQAWQVRDGALVGSHGPRPVVRWVKVKEDKGTK